MKIGFAGAGAIGCHYGSKLQQSGFDVRLLARGKHLSVLQNNGLSHESDGETQIIPIHASADMAQLKPCQVIIISCKMTGLAAMLSALQGIIQPDTMLVSLQNGVEAPDLIAAAFPHHTIIAGTAFIGARLEKPGHVIHSAAGGIRLGMWQHGRSDQLLALLIEVFQQAAVAARIDDDPAAMLWRKLLWNCGFNAITAITRRHARDIASHDETLRIVQLAMQETLALAQSRGIAIGSTDIAKHIEITLNMGAVKTSMWQDIEAGRATEVDYINGYVAREAAKQQMPASTNAALTSLIHAMQAREPG